MKYYLYQVLDGEDVETLQKKLEKKGLKHTFVIEEDATGEVFIGGHGKKRIELQNIRLVEEKEAVVDWQEQWSLFASDFRDGKSHICLGEKTLLLLPGPGFGDLSHPTTDLMLEMLKTYADQESIIDIGAGSGILALASLLLGAKSAVGIDIDSAAIQHAKENAKANGLKAKFSKTIPKHLPKGNICLMNMIFPEQKKFNPKRLNRVAKIWIVSGILKVEKKPYLALAKTWSWKLVEEREKGEWLGLVFKVAEPS